MRELLGDLLKDWSFQAAKRMADAKYETDPMGRRLIEHGAMCMFNCAMAIRHVLLAECAGQTARDLALEVFQQNPEGP